MSENMMDVSWNRSAIGSPSTPGRTGSRLRGSARDPFTNLSICFSARDRLFASPEAREPGDQDRDRFFASSEARELREPREPTLLVRDLFPPLSRMLVAVDIDPLPPSLLAEFDSHRSALLRRGEGCSPWILKSRSRNATGNMPARSTKTDAKGAQHSLSEIEIYLISRGNFCNGPHAAATHGHSLSTMFPVCLANRAVRREKRGLRTAATRAL